MRTILYAAVSLAAAALLTAGTATTATADGSGTSGTVACGTDTSQGAAGVTIPVLSPEHANCNTEVTGSSTPAAPASDD